MRNEKFQLRIQRYGWDKAADCYEQLWGSQIAPAQLTLFELAAFQPGERVLDIACGTGLATFPAAEAVGASGEVVATDISEKMLEAGRTLAQMRNVQNVTFERMDAGELRFPDHSFDVVICSLGLMYAPDPAAALREMDRVLRPGGRAVAAVWGERNQCGWAGIFPVVDSRVQSDVCPMFFQLGTGDVLAQLMQTSGFHEATTRRLRTQLLYETADQASGAAFAGGPVAMAWSRFDDQMRAEAQAEYVASIEPYRNGGGYRIPGEFVITRGRKSPAQ